VQLVPPLPPGPDDLFDEVVDDLTDQEILDAQARATDAANADAVASLHGPKYRYAREWEAWLAWTGTHWQRVGADVLLFRDVVHTARREYALCKGRLVRLESQTAAIASQFMLGSPELKAHMALIDHEKALLKWHNGSQNTAKVNACISQLRAPLSITFLDLDKNPWLLNCANGTVDLRTGELRDHSPEDLITNCLEIPYLPDRKAPLWTRFLDTCMGNSTLLVLYLQRLVGYTLTASTQEHLLVFCYGATGSNGKSTFLRVMQQLLGPYGAAAPRTMLFAQKAGDVHPTELATLHGKRLGVCSEVGEEARIDEAKVKDLTGGDRISCRRMQEDFWDYLPTHKLWIAGNHKPVITGTDGGIWRRIRVVPWLRTFAPEEQDKDLPAKLKAELPGILAWAVRGTLEWLRIGVCDPPEVLEATAEYRAQSDPVGDFLRAHVVFDREARMAAKALRTAYESWCEEMGHQPVGARRLAQRLRLNGVTDTTLRIEGRPVNGWAGVRLLAIGEFPREPPPAPPNA
jgi:putative DNA primase/helicase